MADSDHEPPKPDYPRLFSPNASPQVKVIGLKPRPFVDVYHRLLTLSWPWFLVWCVGVYLGVNTLFAVLYWLGPNALSGGRPGSFKDAFFFSVQTLGTIGYGAMSPKSTYANVLVTGEAFVSIALTSMLTGLFFARISRPTARVVFSRNAVVTVTDGTPTLMFRAANVRVNQILEAEVSLSLARRGVTQEGVQYRRFVSLTPVRARSPLFGLTWTIMHVIDEASPLYGATQASLIEEEAEIIVVLSGTDETFAQRIHARHSYIPAEIVWNHRMTDILSVSPEGARIIDYRRFHDLSEVNAP